jgi:formate--tetrahydrofolate ligase
MVVPREELTSFYRRYPCLTAAHNLLAAMVDNRIHFDGPAGLLDGRTVTGKEYSI